jgi:hypothetical protein
MASSASKRKCRGPSWKDEDLHRMLDYVAEVLPQGENDWAKVATLFTRFGWHQTEVNQFKKL